MALFKLCRPLQFNIWSKPLWVRRRACVIQRVVDSWLGMLPPEEEPAAKYTQRAGAACTLGGRGRRRACTLPRNHRRSRSREVLARKPAKEERRPILEPGGPGRCSRLNALQCTVSLLPAACIMPGWSEVYNNDCSCSNPVRMISTGWGSGWYPQAAVVEADLINQWSRILSLNQWEGRFTLEF